MQDDAVRADALANPQGVGERRDRLLAELGVGGRAVDQVDRVDHDALDPRALDRLAVRREVAGSVFRRAPRARALVEDLDRLGARLHAAFDGLVETPRRGNVATDQHGGPEYGLASVGRVNEAPHLVRFAPSPTGPLHIGGARTALYNWLTARHGGGRLILRIEDTDRERSTPENVEQILDALRWLELDWDEGPFSQAERAPAHTDAIERLLAAGHAYEDEGAVRLRVPDEGETAFHDAIRGEIATPNSSIDDFVIRRSDGSALYNLAVAVDDRDMGITQVVRGEDHISNTPRQVMILRALGEEPPAYAHLPLLHGPDGKKLSKRHGAASVQELRAAGYLPEAVRNYIALLGWGYDESTTF